MSISVVIPAYLEAENLKVLLPRLQSTLKAINIPFEIIIVDTMTDMDDTSKICTENESIHIHREGGNNYGNAIRTGIKYAKHEHIVMMDADGSHEPEDITKMYLAALEGNDIVISSRYVNSGKTDNIFILRFMSYVVNFTYRILFNVKAKDISTSFRVYNAKKLKSLTLTSKDFDIVEEILILFINSYKESKIKELSTHFKKRMHGKTKRNLIKFMFSYLFTILKLYKIKLVNSTSKKS